VENNKGLTTNHIKQTIACRKHNWHDCTHAHTHIQIRLSSHPFLLLRLTLIRWSQNALERDWWWCLTDHWRVEIHRRGFTASCMQTRTNNKDPSTPQPHAQATKQGKKNEVKQQRHGLASQPRWTLTYDFDCPLSLQTTPIYPDFSNRAFFGRRIQGYALLLFPPCHSIDWYPYIGAKNRGGLCSSWLAGTLPFFLARSLTPRFSFWLLTLCSSGSKKEGRFHKSRRSVLVVARMHGDKELLSHAHKWQSSSNCKRKGEISRTQFSSDQQPPSNRQGSSIFFS
jgi:hypothetical protein